MRRSKKPTLVTQYLENISSEAFEKHTTGQTKTLSEKSEKSKNPAAVSLGRLRALEGGKARAKKLSARKRKAIALKGAKVRWSKSE